MVRIRAVVCTGLVLSLGLLLATPASAAVERRAPEVPRLAALWQRLADLLDDLLGAPALRSTYAAGEIGTGTPEPPPPPPGRGGMDPNG